MSQMSLVLRNIDTFPLSQKLNAFILNTYENRDKRNRSHTYHTVKCPIQEYSNVEIDNHRNDIFLLKKSKILCNYDFLERMRNRTVCNITQNRLVIHLYPRFHSRP